MTITNLERIWLTALVQIGTLQTMLAVCVAITTILKGEFSDIMRRFAVIGHRAMSSGKLPLNDLASGAGRMDVMVRA